MILKNDGGGNSGAPPGAGVVKEGMNKGSWFDVVLIGPLLTT
jgi:hypothetical protein